MTGQTGPVPDIGHTVRMIRRVALTPCGCACGMAVDTIPAVRHQTGFPADILQGRKLRVTPDTRLIVAVDGVAVFRVAGVTVDRRPQSALPGQARSAVGHDHRMAAHTGKGIHIGPGIVYMIDGIRLAPGDGFHMAADTIGDLYQVEGAAVESHMRSDTDTHLAYIHDGRIGRMTPDAGIVSGVLRDTVDGMTGVASRGIRGPVPDPCQTVTS